MEKKITELLEGLLDTLDPSKEVLTESIRTDMAKQFVEAMTAAVESETETLDEAVQSQMVVLQKAFDVKLTEAKDASEVEIAELMTEAVEAVAKMDESFAKTLEFTVATFDERSVEELVSCKEAFDTYLETEMEDLAESVEYLIENKLELEQTNESLDNTAKLEKLSEAFESMKKILFSGVVLDEKIEESVGTMKEDYDKLLQQNIKLSRKLNKLDVDTFIESETDAFTPSLKDYLVERFENAKLSDIKEKWEDAQEDYKKIDEENRRLATEDIDDLNIDSHLNEDVDDDAPVNESFDPYKQASQQYAKYI